MKKNYVYKVCKNGVVCADLNTAVQVAVSDMGNYLSKPLVTKVQGGYNVTVVDRAGHPYQRRIDVFEPAKAKSSKKFFMDRTFHFEEPEQDEYEVKPITNKKICTIVRCDCCGKMIEGDKAYYFDGLPYCDKDCAANECGVVSQCVSCKLFQEGDCDGAIDIAECDDYEDEEV